MEGESSSSLQLIEENVVIEMTNIIEVDEPRVGMMVENYKQLLEYYTGYGKRLGFQVKIRSSTKVDDGELKYDCRPSESDAIGFVDGQPTSEAIDVLGTQESIGMTDLRITQTVNVGISDGQYSSLQFCNNNMALLWGVTQRGLGNHFMVGFSNEEARRSCGRRRLKISNWGILKLLKREEDGGGI
ncbi:unnamed protein product [Ilex paraguariensis]|uniref:Uncharacterized protein n=1 Tax=Ilex paraguariensis TaxID=185542 RepID=A0ABC8UA28_9AQUA